MTTRSQPTVQEAIGVFFDVDHLKAAIDGLVESGVDRSEIGLLAGEQAIREELSDYYTATDEFADSSNAPCTAFVADRVDDDTFHALLGGLFFYGTTTAAGAVVASAAILGGAVIGAATGVAAVAAAGTVMGLLIHQSDSDFLDEQLDEGHLLLFVRTADADRGESAVRILAEHGAFEPKVYSVAACR